MRVLLIDNKCRQVGAGADVVVNQTAEILEKQDLVVKSVIKFSKGLDTSLRGKFRAFASGIYSWSSYFEIKKHILSERPDVVHVHNLYPLFSPSILSACRQLDVPVVLTCHSFYLICPTHFLFHNGNVCESCIRSREYWCILKNCRGNIFESIAYSIRTMFARKFKLFKNNATVLIALAEFAKQRLINVGFDKERIVVIPNMVFMPNEKVDPVCGKYISYVGRLSPEKGIETLLGAVAKSPQLPVRIAGNGGSMTKLRTEATANVKFMGWLNRSQITELYKNSRCVVLPSICLEMCPLAVLEAMSHGLPVIASRIGGITEIVEDGITGLLFEPGNHEELAKKIKFLWNNPETCQEMGAAARKKIFQEHSIDIYYRRLRTTYERAIRLHEGSE